MTSNIVAVPYRKGFKWSDGVYLNFEDYSITETDFRVKTAKFKSSEKISVDNTNFAVRITGPHETFTGVILSRSQSSDDKLWEYQCQDWNRIYQDKLDLNINSNVYTIVKKILKQSNGSTAGLKKISMYDQGRYGSAIRFNPFKTKKNISLKHDKTSIEAIKSLIYSQKPFVDIHYNDKGVIQFTPYYLDEWLQPTCQIDRVIDYDVKIDTTNILTNVSGYNFRKLFNSKVDYLSGFISVYGGVDDPSNKGSSSSSNGNKSTAKTSKGDNKTNNPYGTKTKNVFVAMDRCWGGSTDSTYLNNFAKEMGKLGWKVHKLGIGPGHVIPGSLRSDIKNGIYLILGNGADCEVFRHIGHDKFFKGMLLRRNCRAVIGLINDSGDIRRGGRYYSHLGMAHDGTGKGSPGLRYPAGYFADCGVPFFYSKGRNPKGCAQLFNSGGESEIALNRDYKKRLKGYYANWNWSSKY